MAKIELENGFNELYGAFERFRFRARAAVPKEMVGVQLRDGKPFQLWGHLFASGCIEGREITVPYIFQTFVRMAKPSEVETTVDGRIIRFESQWFHYGLVHPAGFLPPINAGEITPEDIAYSLHRTQAWPLDLPQNPDDARQTYNRVLAGEEMIGRYRQMRDFLKANPDQRAAYSRYIEFVANEMILKERGVKVLGQKNLLVIALNNGETTKLTPIEH